MFRFFFFLSLIIFPPLQWHLFFLKYKTEIWLPKGIFLLFSSEPDLPDWLGSVVGSIYLLALIASCFGIFTRIFTKITVLILFFTYSYFYCIGFFNFIFAPIFLVALVLAFSPCHHGLSIDQFLIDYRTRQKAKKLEGIIYGAPIRCIQFIFVLLFWCAGLAKLSNTGWVWASGSGLSDQLILGIFQADLNTFPEWRLRLIRLLAHKPYHFIAGTSVMALELITPCAYFFYRSKSFRLWPILIVGLFIFQLATWYVLFVVIMPFLVIYLAWIFPMKPVNNALYNN